MFYTGGEGLRWNPPNSASGASSLITIHYPFKGFLYTYTVEQVLIGLPTHVEKDRQKNRQKDKQGERQRDRKREREREKKDTYTD